MLKKFAVFTLVVFLINIAGIKLTFASGSSEEKAAAFSIKVKEEIAKLGVGKDALIEVKLRDKTKLKGYVGERNADSFVVVDAKSGASNKIPYSAVKQARGNNLNEGVKIAIGIAVFVAVILIVVAVGFSGGTDH